MADGNDLPAMSYSTFSGRSTGQRRIVGFHSIKMCELSQFTYSEGSVVWVKLGSCWWPGEVRSVDNLPEEILQNLKKKPFTAVKFFDEDKYEYVRNLNNICLYNNRRKNEFIRKGLDMARAKAKEGSSLMKKFPNDVVTAECKTGGDPNILTKDAFAPQERPNYRDIFGESPGKKKSSKKNNSPNKSFSDRKPGRPPSNGQSKSWKELQISSPRVVPKITHRRFVSESDHEVRIRQQPCTPPKEEAISPVSSYKCHICGFTSSRLNVIVLHNKAQHSESAIAAAKLQTPSSGKKKRTPIGRMPSTSSVSKQKNRNSEVKDTASRAKKNILGDSEKKKTGTDEGIGEKSSASVRKKGKANAKKKRETEVRESLLADWGEEDQEEEEKEIENLKLVLGSSRKLEEDSLVETADKTIPPEKESVIEEVEVKPSEASPEKTTENPSDSRDLEEEFKNLMDETSVPAMPEVPVLNSSLPSEGGTRNDIAEEMPENDMKKQESVGNHEENENMEQEDASLANERDKSVISLESSVAEPELKKEDNAPVLPPAKEDTVINTPPPMLQPPESQISVMKSEVEQIIAPSNNQITPETLSEPQAPAPVNQETYSILPISSDSQKTEMSASITVSLPSSNSLVEGLPTRSLVSAASTEEATETATYVLVTIDDSGALQPIDNMNSVVNTALLALDGQQDDGPRTLYIDPSQLGTQGTDLENIFLAIDTRGDMATQMVELANRNSDQPEVQGQTFAAAAAASAAKAKSAQDILAVALANTQVFQGDGSYVTLNPAASTVTVTSSRSAQAPVMTPRVVDPCRSSTMNATPPINNTPTMSDLPGHIGEVQRPVNMPPPAMESPSFHSQLPPPLQTLPTHPPAVHPMTQTTVVTLSASLPHLNSDDSANRLDTSAVPSILTLPSLIPTSYAPVGGVGNGQTTTTLTLISGANLIMDQVTQALPKVDTDSVVETSRDHVAEKRKLDCDVRESKQMRVDENGGS